MTRVFFALIAALTVFMLNGAPAGMALAAGDGTAVASVDPKDDDTGAAAKVTGEVDVDVADNDNAAWYLSPTWIVIGVLAVGVLVAIIVAASRGGGGTTVIKD